MMGDRKHLHIEMRRREGLQAKNAMRGTNSKKRGLTSRTGHRRVGISFWLRKNLISHLRQQGRDDLSLLLAHKNIGWPNCISCF